MSVAALTWAFAQEIRPATHKFVLVALADYANENLEAYPSIGALEAKTCVERRGIFRALADLKDAGFIEPTGERKGTTRQIHVYRIKGCQIGNSSEKGDKSVTVTKMTLKGDKSAPLKGCQNGNTEPSVLFNRQEPSEIYKRRPSTQDETVSYVMTLGLPASDGEWLWDKWQGNGFKNNGKAMNCWKSTARCWRKQGTIFPSHKNKTPAQNRNLL